MPTHPLIVTMIFVVRFHWLQDVLSIFVNLYCVNTLLIFIGSLVWRMALIILISKVIQRRQVFIACQ